MSGAALLRKPGGFTDPRIGKVNLLSSPDNCQVAFNIISGIYVQTAYASGPDGTTTAQYLGATGSNGFMIKTNLFSPVAGDTYNFSFYAKKATVEHSVAMYIADSAGVVRGSVTTFAVTATWQLIQAQYTYTANATNERVVFGGGGTFNNAEGDNMLIWRPWVYKV